MIFFFHQIHGISCICGFHCSSHSAHASADYQQIFRGVLFECFRNSMLFNFCIVHLEIFFSGQLRVFIELAVFIFCFLCPCHIFTNRRTDHEAVVAHIKGCFVVTLRTGGNHKTVHAFVFLILLHQLHTFFATEERMCFGHRSLAFFTGNFYEFIDIKSLINVASGTNINANLALH